MTNGPVRTRERRTLKAVAGLTVVVLAVLGFASYKLVTSARQPAKPAAVAEGQSSAAHRTPVVASARPKPSPSPSASPAPTTPAASPTTPAASPTTLNAQVLKPVSATAFGPEGTADGDGPQQTGYAIDASMTTNWRTDWYATARFAALQAGTGLLIDMGRAVTIADVQVNLGSEPGADLELRAGNTAAMADLPRLASSAGADGTVQLKPATQTRARYILLWFTALPPDGIGTYQGRVYNVSVAGVPLRPAQRAVVPGGGAPASGVERVTAIHDVAPADDLAQ